MSPLLARCAFWQDNDTGNSGYTVRILCRETGERLENFSAVRIAEIYTSIQGEGFLTGTTSSFVRVTGCNLRCWFCDTPYTSWNPQGETLEVCEILQRVKSLGRRHVVITGGEPMMYTDLVPLCGQLRAANHHITLETAGTRFLPLDCDLMSISPKLANSVPSRKRAAAWRERHEQRRHRPAVIRQLIDAHTNYQMKFVIDRPPDCLDVIRYLKDYPQIPRERVLLMPQGIDGFTLASKREWLEPWCHQRGFHYCPRKQIEWFGKLPAS